MILIKQARNLYSQCGISNLSIDSLKKIVGGDIELVTLRNYDRSNKDLKDIVLIVREDGAIIPNPQLNMVIGKTNLFGTIVVAAFDKAGELRQLTAKEITLMDKYCTSHSMNDWHSESPTDLFGDRTNA